LIQRLGKQRIHAPTEHAAENQQIADPGIGLAGQELRMAADDDQARADDTDRNAGNLRPAQALLE
jgi:hypothetical protein